MESISADDVNQLTTEDEADQFAESFQGTLTFAPEPQKDAEPVHFPPSLVKPEGAGSTKLVFEITNTRIVKEKKDKHVTYTVSILKSHSDQDIAYIYKRYTEFYHFHKQLKKNFPKIMKTIIFPKKKMLGNFSASTISDRSKAFEKYLDKIATVDTIRKSMQFSDFFYMNDIHEGYKLLKERKFPAAAQIFQNAQLVQRKLIGDHDMGSIYTLCAVCAALWADQQHNLALSYAELTLQCINGDTSNKFLVPLINLSIQLCWHLGKDKKDLESKLQAFKTQGVSVDYTQSLLDLILSTPLM